jgi:hypothetical protein
MTGQRRNRTARASIPYRSGPAVQLTSLFFEADLAAAIDASGIKPVAECDLRLVAQGISMGVMDVLFLAYRSTEPSNAERAKYFKKVAAASEHLLQLLDERDNVRTLVNDTKIEGGLTGDGGGLRRLMAEVYILLPEY